LPTTEAAHDVVDRVFREEQGRAVATLIRVLGDFDAAEEALHDAFRAALEQWPRDGVPSNPRAATPRIVIDCPLMVICWPITEGLEPS